MDNIIFDDPADDPNNYGGNADDGKKRKELFAQIDSMLDNHRPDRYTTKSTNWMAPVIDWVKDYIGGENIEELISRSAASEVIRREGNAKRQAASYFRSYGQLTLGEGTEVQLQMLHDKRHLPVPINEIDVVRLGALTPSDVADLRMTRDHEEKLRAEAAGFELSGIDMLADLLRDTGCPDVDSMF
jgi:hypothetical protein